MGRHTAALPLHDDHDSDDDNQQETNPEANAKTDSELLLLVVVVIHGGGLQRGQFLDVGGAEFKSRACYILTVMCLPSLMIRCRTETLHCQAPCAEWSSSYIVSGAKLGLKAARGCGWRGANVG